MDYIPFEDSKNANFGFYLLDDAVEVQADDTFYLLSSGVQDIIEAKNKRELGSKLPFKESHSSGGWFMLSDSGVQIKQSFAYGFTNAWLPHSWLKQIIYEMNRKMRAEGR
ncbi:hypothetical protein FT641_18305 [Bacillus paranthracis]|uniref:hypothetical protein n=1 Tax=Bacillus paranthracis TaxID=2026186 RepID=UPI00187A7300|nr:hypothetical protein [Bacillus paranthracis]MBE7114484.1 hypothetical protein [Bacillus paranthracis]MBE7154642.1 hypothetical protein [Bacillus paranthracis]